jgi:hypothetical protein
MSNSWYVLPNGKPMALTATQDLLVELVPVVEDMTIACQRLRCALAESVRRLEETRRLIIRSRRQRLDLQLITRERPIENPEI